MTTSASVNEFGPNISFELLRLAGGSECRVASGDASAQPRQELSAAVAKEDLAAGRAMLAPEALDALGELASEQARAGGHPLGFREWGCSWKTSPFDLRDGSVELADGS